MRLTSVLCLLCIPVLLAGCPRPETHAETDAAAAGSDVAVKDPRYEQGRKIYNFHCYYCHGYSGDAKTLSATYIDPKPRDFTRVSPEQLSRERMLKSVREGRAGTAMASYKERLSDKEIEEVVDFIRHEFMQEGRENTRYHIPGNGWIDHARYAPAYTFATGQTALDTPDETLTPEQRRGKKLYLSSCVSCHDRARVMDEGPVWEPSVVSYPRNNGMLPSPPPLDVLSGASVYARHDQPHQFDDLDAEQQQGEALYQQNCAFCHAADGTGRNWIGTFLEPHPRNLTDTVAMQGMTSERLSHVIREGLPGTGMPAWKTVLTKEQTQQIVAYVRRAFYPGRRAAIDE
ncbi:Cytochrome c oxidase subunit CcoO [hydrothermal vent metagenome]|uniref:Cytochrome c oxidase subunit CcoO n=1 Tax=hydrothermal vent metagenome TaxID=652676 RepID=A0A3B0Y5U5_9ZZZZ